MRSGEDLNVPHHKAHCQYAERIVVLETAEPQAKTHVPHALRTLVVLTVIYSEQVQQLSLVPVYSDIGK